MINQLTNYFSNNKCNNLQELEDLEWIEGKNVLISGDSRTGKTYLILKLLRESKITDKYNSLLIHGNFNDEEEEILKEKGFEVVKISETDYDKVPYIIEKLLTERVAVIINTFTFRNRILNYLIDYLAYELLQKDDLNVGIILDQFENPKYLPSVVELLGDKRCNVQIIIAVREIIELSNIYKTYEMQSMLSNFDSHIALKHPGALKYPDSLKAIFYYPNYIQIDRK